MATLRDLTLADALAVVGDMRPMDAECVRAACGQEPGEWFAVDRWRAHGAGWTIVEGGQATAIGGLSLPQPWLGVLWLVLHGWAGASMFAQRLGLQLEGIRHGAGARGESIEVWATAPKGMQR